MDKSSDFLNENNGGKVYIHSKAGKKYIQPLQDPKELKVQGRSRYSVYVKQPDFRTLE